MTETEDRTGHFRQIFMEVSDAIVVYDPADGVVVEANPAASELTGYARDVLEGRPVSQFSAGSAAAVERAATRIVEESAAGDQRFEWPVERADGAVRQTEVSLHRTDVDGEDRVLAILRDVTEARRDRAAAEEDRTRLHQLTDASPDVFWVFTPDFSECLFVNDAYGAVYGRSVEALRSNPEDFLQAVHPDDRADVQTAMERLANGSRVNLEYRVNEGEGYGRWVWVEGIPLAGEEGVPDRILGFSRDITERKQLERTLADRTSQLEALTENVPVVLYQLDEDGVFVHSSGRGLEDLGRESGQVVGRSIEEVYADNERILEACQQALAGESVARTVEVGDLVFDAWYEPIVDEHGAVTGVMGVAVNVTERAEFEAELEANEAALSDLHTRAARTDLEMDERIQLLLDIGRERLDLPYGFLTNISAGTQYIVQALGTHAELQSGASAPLEQAYCRRTIEQDGLLGIQDAAAEGWADDPAYERFGLNCYIGGKLLVEDELYGTVCFASSDTRDRSFTDSERAFVELLVQWLAYELERDRRETVLEHIGQELRRQNEQLEEFADVVAHDVRGPLTAARGFLELALETADEEHFRQVEAAHARMERLIDDLLTLARQGRSIDEWAPVDLGEVARSAWPQARGAATLAIEPGLPALNGDAPRLEAALSNLFRNAIEHGGEAVTVTLGPLEDQAGFYVADDGPGIPVSKRPHVFDFGYSSNPNGTGLGLAIVDEVLAAHGWEITITEAPDGGARFEVRTGERDSLPDDVGPFLVEQT